MNFRASFTLNPSSVLFAVIALPLLGLGEVSAAQQVPAVSASRVDSLLQPGDVVRLKIWREPDLSGDFEVNAAGEVVLPKIGPRAVLGMPRDSLQRMLIAAYASSLRNPSIEVTLLKRVNVLGAVQNPGLYQIDPTLTVADVLALAGGPTNTAKNGKVELRRRGQRLSTKLSNQTRISETRVQSGDQLFVPERSWLSRNGGVLGAAITALGVIVATTLR